MAAEEVVAEEKNHVLAQDTTQNVLATKMPGFQVPRHSVEELYRWLWQCWRCWCSCALVGSSSIAHSWADSQPSLCHAEEEPDETSPQYVTHMNESCDTVLFSFWVRSVPTRDHAYVRRHTLSPGGVGWRLHRRTWPSVDSSRSDFTSDGLVIFHGCGLFVWQWVLPFRRRLPILKYRIFGYPNYQISTFY